MAVDLAAEARERGIKYFLISYVDLFGTLRAKLAPAAAIGDMARDGAGFAGFASWLDMTPADPDVLAIPDPSSLIQLPWKREVGWLAADPYMNGKLVEQAPRNVLKKMVAKAADAGLRHEDRRRMRVLPGQPRRRGDQRRGGHPIEALLRPVGADAPLRRDQRDLRFDARARLGAVSERSRGRQRPVRDELAVRRRADHRGSAWRSSNTWSRRSPRSMACVRPSCRNRSSTSPAAAATCMCRCGRATRTCSRTARTGSGCRARPIISSAG